MNKKQKFTQAYFNEADPMMEITTHNTDLKRRLRRFAEQYPELCWITEIDEGCMSVEIDKRRCSFKLTEPYSEERKRQLRESGKAQGIHTRCHSEEAKPTWESVLLNDEGTDCHAPVGARNDSEGGEADD